MCSFGSRERLAPPVEVASSGTNRCNNVRTDLVRRIANALPIAPGMMRFGFSSQHSALERQL
eukprot:119093-Amphidinium_carterae.1